MEGLKSCFIETNITKSRYYPFDKHVCKLSFQSWLYDSSRILTVFDEITDPTEEFRANKQFTLIKLNFSSFIEESGGLFYSIAKMEIFVRRLPYYHLVNLFFPCTLITLISSLVFVIRPESDAKITFSLTILLSLNIFILLMFEKLPETSETIPLLSMTLLCAIFSLIPLDSWIPN